MSSPVFNLDGCVLWQTTSDAELSRRDTPAGALPSPPDHTVATHYSPESQGKPSIDLAGPWGTAAGRGPLTEAGPRLARSFVARTRVRRQPFRFKQAVGDGEKAG
jgi:hypothetical protein